MDRPVCGNTKRFNNFRIPTLLIYDVEDNGHPIWQGKQLYKEMAKTEFYSFRTSQEPYWVHENIWNIMLRFLDKYSRRQRSEMKNEFHQTYKSLEKRKDRSYSASKKSRKKVVSMDRWEKKERKE